MSAWDKEDDTMSDTYVYENENSYGNAPALPNFDLDMNVGSIAPIFGVAGGDEYAEYLNMEVKGHSMSQKLYYYTGVGYASGLIAGGVFGVMEGMKNQRNKSFKIRMNSILNASGRRGSRFGNALGAVCLMYSGSEIVLESIDFDRYVPMDDRLLPIMGGAFTGAVYKCTAGPRPMALAGVIGGGIMAALTAAQSVLSKRY